MVGDIAKVGSVIMCHEFGTRLQMVNILSFGLAVSWEEIQNFSSYLVKGSSIYLEIAICQHKDKKR